MIYRFVGWIFGLKLFSLMDSFYLYDLPANPIMVPVYCTLKKPDQTDEQVIDVIFDKMVAQNEALHLAIRLRKIMGMYFFQ